MTREGKPYRMIKEEKLLIIKLYFQGYTGNRIAVLLNRNPATIYQFFRKEGLEY